MARNWRTSTPARHANPKNTPTMNTMLEPNAADNSKHAAKPTAATQVRLLSQMRKSCMIL